MKLKNDFRYMFEVYKQSIETQKFKIIFVLCLISAIYSTLLTMHINYLDALFFILSSSFNVVITLLIMFLNIANVFEIFNNNQFYILRIKNKKDYLKELTKHICFSNICTLSILLALNMIGLNIFCQSVTYNDVIYGYGNELIYFIYAIIRFIILIIIYSLINVCGLKIFNKNIVFIINIIFYYLIFTYVQSIAMITKISDISLNPATYFNFIKYSSFEYEIIVFAFYTSLLYIFYSTLKKITLIYMKDVTK